MLSNPNEVIVWRDAEHELPDEGMTVMVFTPDSKSDKVWFGYLEDGEWIWSDGGLVASPVVAWAEMPAGPGKNGETEE
jgi:hypothetical protein